VRRRCPPFFVLGVARGVQGTLQGLAFKAWVRPRLAPPSELEDPRPPRFAQLVGLLVVGAGLLFAALGFPAAVPIAAAVALVAAFLNAAFGLCLGCELLSATAPLGPPTLSRRALGTTQTPGQAPGEAAIRRTASTRTSTSWTVL
jgi:hypothetical protein